MATGKVNGWCDRARECNTPDELIATANTVAKEMETENCGQSDLLTVRAVFIDHSANPAGNEVHNIFQYLLDETKIDNINPFK